MATTENAESVLQIQFAKTISIELLKVVREKFDGRIISEITSSELTKEIIEAQLSFLKNEYVAITESFLSISVEEGDVVAERFIREQLEYTVIEISAIDELLLDPSALAKIEGKLASKLTELGELRGTKFFIETLGTDVLGVGILESLFIINDLVIEKDPVAAAGGWISAVTAGSLGYGLTALGGVAAAASTPLSIAVGFGLSVYFSLDSGRKGLEEFIDDLFEFFAGANEAAFGPLYAAELSNGAELIPHHIIHKVLLNRIDGTFSEDNINRIYEASSVVSNQGAEELLRALEKTIIGLSSSDSINDGEAYHSRVIDLFLRIDKDSGAKLQYLGDETTDIQRQAGRDDDIGLAVRYALRELNPFVITGTDGLYDKHNLRGIDDVGILDIENFSDEYINDRVSMLRRKITKNVADLDVSFGTGSKTYEDRATAENLTVIPLSDGTPVVQPPIYVIFGSDQSDDGTLNADGVLIPKLIGTDDIDRIYGGIGDDDIQGEMGDDYLEGGGGDDKLSGGLGKDTLIGGRGNDELRLYEDPSLIFHGDGYDDIAEGGAGNDDYFGLAGGDKSTDEAGNDNYFVTFEKGEATIDDIGGEGAIFFAAGEVLTGGELVVATSGISIFKSADDAFIYTKRTNLASGTEEVSVRRSGPIGNEGNVLIKNFTPGALGITLDSGTVPDVVEFAGTTGDELILDFADGTIIERRESGAVAHTVIFPSVVQRIDGLDGDDAIQINTDIPDLLIYGDSAGAGAGGDGDDWIEVDRVNVGGEIIPVTFGNGAYLFGEGGDDYLLGSQRNDWLIGADGHDAIAGRFGADQASGGAGNDWVEGGGGNDVLYGDTGNDRLWGGAGADVLRGGSGNDKLWGDASAGGFFRTDASTFWSGSAELVGFVEALPGTSLRPISSDAELGDGGGDVLEGGDGNDLLSGGEGVDFLYGDADHDVLQGEAGDDWLFGGPGNDVLWGDKDPMRFDADHAADSDEIPIFRQHADGKDVIGDDNLSGGRGFDILRGGDGNDIYHFGYGDGNDVIADTAGIDSIRLTEGISSSDIKLIESGGDLIVQLASHGTPTGDQLIVSGWFSGKPVESIVIGETTILNVADIEAATGKKSDSPDASASEALNLVLLTDSADTSLAGATPGADAIYGLGGNDVIAGGSGDDRLVGGDGDDELSGGNDNDTLVGEFGDDSLFGHTGDDVLVGGIGDDDLLGGAGNDTYIFNRGDGDDFILDDGGAADRIVFGDGIDAEDVTIDVSGDNLILDIREHGALAGDKITIVDGFLSGTEIETIEFDDGKLWDAAEISSHLPDTHALDDAVSAVGGTGVSTYTLGTDLDDGFSISVSDAGGVDILDLKVGTSGSFTFTPVLNSSSRDGDDLLLDSTIVSTLGSVPDVTGEIRITDFYTDAGFIETIKFGPTVLNAPNEAPAVIGDIPDQIIALDTPFTFVVPTGTFNDSPFDYLRLDAKLADGTDLPGWLVFDPVAKTFNGTPTAGDLGIVEIEVAAIDSKNLSTTMVFELNVGNVNVAPAVVAPIPDVLALEGSGFNLFVPSDAFADPNLSEVVTVTVSASDDTSLPTWLTYDSASSLLSGTPGIADVGPIAVKVTGTDSGGLEVADTFTIVVDYINDTPVLEIPAFDQLAVENVPFSFSLAAGTFSDSDSIHGDTLSYSVTDVDGSAGPGWLLFDESTLTFSGRPVGIFADTGFNLRLTATDNDGASASTDFALSVDDALGAVEWFAPQLTKKLGVPIYERSDGVSAALKGGGYVVIWTSEAVSITSSAGRDGFWSGIFGQRFSPSGAKVGVEFQINTATFGHQTTPSVAGTSDGGFVVSWGENDTTVSVGGEIYSQKFNANAIMVGPEHLHGLGYESVVTALAGGGHVVAWRDFGTDLVAQRFTTGGELDGAPTVLAGGITSQEYNITGLLDGSYVVAWQSGDSDGWGISGQRYSANGAPLGPLLLVNDSEMESQIAPSVAALATGGFVIVWEERSVSFENGKIWGQRYNASGAEEGVNFQIDLDPFPQVDPAVTGLPDGGFVVSWASNKNTQWGSIFAKQFDVSGNPVGDGRRINDAPANINSLPTVTALVNGDLAFSWKSSVHGFAPFIADKGGIESRVLKLQPNADVTAISSLVTLETSEFKPLSYRVLDNLIVDPDTAFGDEHVVTATMVDGSPFPDWLSFDEVTSILSGTPLSGDAATVGVRITATDLAGSFAETTINIDVAAAPNLSLVADPASFTVTGGSVADPVSVALDDGSHVVVWDAADGIYGRHYLPGGTVSGSDFLITNNPLRSRNTLLVAKLDDGGVVVAWDEEDATTFTPQFSARKYDYSMSATGSDFVLKDTSGLDGLSDHFEIVGTNGGGFTFLWTDIISTALVGAAGVNAQQFSADPISIPVGPEIGIPSVTPGKPVVASLAGGGVVMVWSEKRDPQLSDFYNTGDNVYARLFDDTFVPIGDAFQVNSNTLFSHGTPAVVGLADGGFAITWTAQSDFSVFASDRDIYGRIFGSDATAFGNEWRINNNTADFQKDSAVAATGDGGFVVAWLSTPHLTSFTVDATYQVQYYDRNGVPPNSVAQNTDIVAKNRTRPAITATADGGYTLFGETKTGDIVGRHFSLTGSDFNAPPMVATPLVDQFATQDAPFSLSIPTGTITDPDLDALTYHATLTGGAALPSWLSFDPTTLQLSGIASNDDVGDYAIAINATDTIGNSVAETFTLWVGNINDAPIATSDTAGLRLDMGTKTISLDVLANDVDVDAGDDPSTFSLDSVTVVGGHGSATIVANQLFFDAGTDFDGLGPNDLQVVTVNYTMSDAAGISSSSAASIAVHNGDAVFGSDGDDIVTASAPGLYYSFGGADVYTLASGGTGSRYVADGAGFGTSSTTYRVTSDSGTATFGKPLGGGIPGTVSFTGLPRKDMLLGLGSLFITFDGTDVELHLEDFDPNDVLGGPRVIETFVFDGIEYSFEEIISQGFDVDGTTASDILTGTNFVDRIDGLAGDDMLASGDGDDTLTGGLGDDSLDGGLGNDAYVYKLGDGHDTITDAGGIDRVVFAAGLSSATAVSSRFGDDLHLSLNATDSITVKNWYLEPQYRIETFAFAEDNLRIVNDELVETIDDNHAPIVTAELVDQSAMQDAALTFDVPAGTFDDVDLDNTLTYGAMLDDGSALPAWLSFDASSNAFSGTPSSGDTGLLSVKVTATDSGGLVVSDSFELFVESTNSAPTVVGNIPDQAIVEGATFNYFVLPSTFVDPDIEDSLSLAATLDDGTVLPSWLSFDANTNTFNGIAPIGAGDVLVKVTATDMFGSSVDDTFLITISAAINIIQGSSDADVLIGTLFVDQINGLGGGDVINADAGDDIVSGGAGNDTIDGGSGNDWIDGGSDHDVIDGGAGDDIVFGGYGNDTITDLLGNEEIHGGEGDDVITTGDGDDVIFGDGHNDTIDAGEGTNWVAGGAGDDVITAGSGNDWIDGGSNDDIINAGAGDDIVFGGYGNDTITDLLGNEEIHGGEGDDVITTGDGDDVIFGDGHNDTIDAGEGTNWVAGGPGDDVITTGSGNDWIDGGSNDDIINAGAGDDIVFGGYGNDTITDLLGNEEIHGGEGDDRITTGDGDDVIFGDGHNDTIDAGEGTNWVDGGAGDDVITAGSGNDWIDGGSNNDIINAGAGDDIVFGGYGNDTITDLLGNEEIHGGEGDDRITTGDGDDVIFGDGHNDTIDAGEGTNRVDGGAGDDVITTGSGNDWIDGGSNNDIINAGAGDDIVFGGYGNDTITDLLGNEEIHGGEGDDRITTGDGDDVIFGDGHNDTIDAGEGTNWVDGGSGDDVITAGSGDDWIAGGNDNDSISGGAGNDAIFGGYGFDILTGGQGDDLLTGFEDGDTYHFERLDGNDTVVELGTGIGDVVKFGSNVAADQIWFSQSGMDLRLDLVGTPDSITVQEWYSYNEPIESFELNDGTYLLNSDVDQLVQAMAAFNIPVGTEISLPLAVAQVVDPVIAAVWQSV